MGSAASQMPSHPSLMPRILFVHMGLGYASCHRHTLARKTLYPDGGAKRQYVPDAFVSWKNHLQEYNPADYTAKWVFKKRGADPTDPTLVSFNCMDGVHQVDRRSRAVEQYLCSKDGRPLNPCGRTGLRGRGILWHWGPNHEVVPIITRLRRHPITNELDRDARGDPVCECVVIKHLGYEAYSMPSGFVDPGMNLDEALFEEFGETARLVCDSKAVDRSTAMLDKVLSEGVTLFKGYLDDKRNTDNAWMETLAVNFHDATGECFRALSLAPNAEWRAVNSALVVDEQHQFLIDLIVMLRCHKRSLRIFKEPWDPFLTEDD